MTAWFITLLSLWSFPILSFFAIRLTHNNSQIRKKIIKVCIVLNILAAFGLLTNISTTLKELDWLVLTSLYFTACIFLWLGFYHNNKVVKFLASFIMIGVFIMGYFLGTIGVLGVGFVVGEYEPSVEKWIGNGIIYKETALGNAVSDYRGKRVEIYKTIKCLPIIEWRVQNKIYQSYISVMTTPLTVDYKPKDKNIYLSASMWLEKERKQVRWSDTLSIGN